MVLRVSKNVMPGIQMMAQAKKTGLGQANTHYGLLQGATMGFYSMYRLIANTSFALSHELPDG